MRCVRVCPQKARHLPKLQTTVGKFTSFRRGAYPQGTGNVSLKDGAALSKYEPLWSYLKNIGEKQIRLSFDEIKGILGFDIDHSFLTYKKEAAQFSYQVGKISLKEKHVDFSKII